MIRNLLLMLRSTGRHGCLRMLLPFLPVLMALPAVAQDAGSATVNISVREVPVTQVFTLIENQTPFRFVYDQSLTNHPKRITLNLRNATVSGLLAEIDRLAGLQFKISGHTVSVTQRTGAPGNGNLREITGIVRDSTGQPMVGVTIQVKDTKTGTGSDVNGRYVLQVPEGAVLSFSMISYRTQEILVGKASKYDVVMHEASSALEEVVIVGFGAQKKIGLVGAQNTISAKDLKQPVSNLTNSLGGRVAGMVSVQRSGELGYNDANIYIRGISTFSAGLSAPLTLVDGVPRSIANLDPEDIESFTVLKDAAATAVYGVRGANGVIIVTTKAGKASKPSYNFRYTEGVTEFTTLPSFADGALYMEMSNEALKTRGNTPIYSDEAIQATRDGSDPYLYPNVNWFDAMFNKTGRYRNANANISGGSEKAVYYVGLSFTDELGMYKTDELSKYNSSIFEKRYNVTSNLTLQPSPTTTVKLGINGYLKNVNLPTTGVGDLFTDAYFMTPTQIPLKYPDGKIADVRSGSLSNPWASLTQVGYANQWRSQINSNLRLTQQLNFLTKGLSVTGMFAFDAYNYTSNRYTKTPDTWLAIGRDADGQLQFEQTAIGTEFLAYTKSNQGERTVYSELALNYDRAFGKDHNVTGMLLYNKSDKINTYAADLETSMPYRMQGLAGRATYGYKNRYFLEANFGYNGSENFHPNKRYGFFPSAGLGWVISDESFFKPIRKYVPFFKARFSHGLVGNSNIDGRRFAYLATVANLGSYGFGKTTPANTTGMEIGEYAVDVTWEEAKKTNLGFDIRLLNEDLSIQVDLFREYRSGIFLRRKSLPAYVGMINAPFANVGIIDNKGIDATFTYNARFGAVNVNLLGNFSYNRNKVVENDDPAWKYPWLDRKGQKVSQRYGYIALGLFESDKDVKNSPRQTGDVRAGDIKFKDLNGDGVIDSYDQAPIGYGDVPEIMYGFGFTVGYKAFSLSALFQGAAHVDVILNGEGTMPFQQGLARGNLFSNITDRWTEENPNPNAFYPRLMPGSLNDNYASSTWWVKNADYMRLKTLQLAYNMPSAWMKRIHFKSANVFLQGVNLLTFSSFKLWDVEIGNGRGAAYSSTRSFAAGIAVNL
ncbi:TonB-dependent receptor [Chitinophaga sp. GCM10012297]|uniref:TonB-dependent receptor n=1 Tax=Chitinophaga chungangae TaxID=2821488 RepID=A0ABS3YJZ7_9BACT|nr:TonB-dependent receptor [Chitinophaga chungangae]MBO9154984.1 TonB-dependent receptor [Chitinophaga chungangae]